MRSGATYKFEGSCHGSTEEQYVAVCFSSGECRIKSSRFPSPPIVPRYSSLIAYPTQFRGSLAPCVSQVFDDSVISTRTYLASIVAGSRRWVALPPLASFTTPAENVFHSPVFLSSMASPVPTQYCTAYTRAYGSPHSIRMAFR